MAVDKSNIKMRPNRGYRPHQDPNRAFDRPYGDPFVQQQGTAPFVPSGVDPETLRNFIVARIAEAATQRAAQADPSLGKKRGLQKRREGR